MSDKEKSKVGLVFIEVLFAIVVGIGLERVIDEAWVAALMSNLLAIDFWFFILGNTVVIGSWVGYHKAMDQGLESEIRTSQEFLRFVIDIVLLFLYARLLTSLDNPQMVFDLIFWVFFFYVLWDCIAITECSLGKHPGATIFWCVFFGVISWVASRNPWPLKNTIFWQMLCAASIFGAFIYRFERLATFLHPCYAFFARQQERLIRHLWKIKLPSQTGG